MKKIASLLLSIMILLSSCKSTFYADNQRLLRNKYMNTPIENVISEYGEPHKIEERTSGKSYIYYYMGKENKVPDPVEQYTRFNIDNNGFVTDVKSTATVETKRISVGKTIGISLLGIVVIAVLASIPQTTHK